MWERDVGGNVGEKKAPVHGVAMKECAVDKAGQQMVVMDMLEGPVVISVLKHQRVRDN